jgi:hypothetical protein
MLDPTLTEEYQLPQLKPATSYDEYQRRNDKLAPRILAAAEEWSSPSRRKAELNLEDTNKWLMQGSLGEMEIQHVQEEQLEIQKKRAISRKSLSKGGSLLASDALQKMAQKRRKEADEALQKATRALTLAENRQKNELTAEGVLDRTAKRERKQWIQQHQPLGFTIPPSMWIPIRDR